MIYTQKSNKSKCKVYKERAIWVGSFLGGPLIAGYLLAENFRTLNQPHKIKPTYIITLLATFLIFGSVLILPENTNIPRQLVPIIYTVIAYGLFKKYQSTSIFI